MAEETNQNPEPEKPIKGAKAEKIKTKQVEIIKFHPLVAHEVGDQPILTEEKADELIVKKYAKALK